MKKLIAIIALCIATYSAKAQELQMESITSFNYSIGIPVGNLSDFISKVSPLGFSIDYKRAITPNIYVGGEFGMNNFYEERSYQTYTEGTASISGIQTRYNTSIPITITADYIYTANNQFKPYFGIGLGTVYNYREIDLGLFNSTINTWFFTIKPEAGVIFNLNSFTGIKLGARYFQTFNTKDIDAYSYFAIDVGFVLMHF
ncbi:outer membrane beta-barrel protein [Galbibacter pacificus]|uniref:Outer membrane beta-barrel protein n=1 Tax=Galbibacter pacificus TaxID=2996052 RepID=A0ABT6FVI5_9FLAO|nr:OmpW family outer membrane protein [Galbibacter pacificus]MDG3583799.1 outer membrane beta-barrel protein [Galbibacter pacificus]MDG3587283.1 outer membrane beta-barrel protein [Galbibacter pacificus]